MEFVSERVSELSYLDENGNPFDVDVLLLSNDEIEPVDVVTSDDRQATILAVARQVVGCAGTNNSTTVSYICEIEPKCEVIPGLYSNVVLARKVVDEWKASLKAAGKSVPKGKEKVANLIISLLVTDLDECLEIVEEGVESYILRNLNIRER